MAAQAAGLAVPWISDVSRCYHADPPCGMASGWGSPVSADRAVATSLGVART